MPADINRFYTAGTTRCLRGATALGILGGLHIEQLNHLVKMVNQIALNLIPNGDEDEVAEQVAAHLERFWSPSMKTLLLDAYSESDIGLSPVSEKAVKQLKEK